MRVSHKKDKQRWKHLQEIINQMYLYGASGHAKVIADIFRSNDIEVQGLFDDNPNIKELIGLPVERTSELKGPLVISIGNNSIRKKIAESISIPFAIGVDRSAIVSKSVIIGDGTVVMQGAIIQACATIGEHAIVNTAVSIDHDCEIGDYVHISPNATLCGNVKVGEGTHVGAGSVIIQGIKIGAWSVIGAGSVVVSDIPDGVLAYGNPCRIIRKI